MKFIDLCMKWKFPLFLGIVLSVLYLHFFENRAVVDLDINVSEKTWFNIYWADADQGYSQWKRARVLVTPEQRQYRFFLTDLRKVGKLRIDTHQYQGEVLLHTLLITQNGVQPLQFTTKDDFSLLQPIFHINSTLIETNGLRVNSSGNDPQLELMLNLQDGSSRSWILFTHIVAILSVVFLFFFLTENFRTEEKFVPVFFAVVFALVLVMAAITKENVHPDEYVHLDAGEYYKTNWLPPVVDDPEINHTYSVYGVSRLNSREVSYLFTGKVAELVSSFRVTKLISLRMFNVLLMGLMLLYLLKTPGIRFMAAPLLISPQIWYVFSYCNSDAFAIAISFIVACQLVLPHSLLNSYLLGEIEKKKLASFILLGILCSLLFLLKKNYLFFIVFIGAYVLWRVLFLVEKEKSKQYLKRLTAILLLGVTVTGLRIGADYAVNGLDRTARMEQIREELATPLYKPSTSLEKQHSFLNRKARGESLETLVVADRWFEKTYRSAFGMYGYFTAVADDAYYNTVRLAGVALFTLLSFAVFFRGGKTRSLLFVVFLTCSSALVGVSLYHSWTADYQTQGRYLFPIVPMACVLLYHTRHLMQGAVYKVLLTAMFLLSVYSFVFIGLLQLPKIS